MSDELKIGDSRTERFAVSDEDCTTRGEFRILSTPSLVGHMERTAMRLMEGSIGPEKATVGTYVGITHTAPALLGQEVSVTAEVTGIAGSRTTFTIAASDATEELAKAEHERFTVDLARLEERLRKKSS
jgi:fluoroacetyl-CoA thioesterase